MVRRPWIIANCFPLRERVDDVGGEMAEGYLEGNKGRLTDVADLLGFSALSAFSRWHKRYFGFTLTERRSGK